jgi:hypothetical protein
VSGPRACREIALKFVAILAWGCVFFAPPEAHAELKPSPVTVLLARARQLHLAERVTWLRLGHYRKRWFGGWKSEVDGDAFFLAEDGKTNPEAELEATLRGLFSSPRVPLSGIPQSEAESEPVQCRFPARREWLMKELAIPASALPQVVCQRWSEFFKLLKPASLTLIFSSYYLNNPASAFGHTFLRVNKVENAANRDGRELLDNGVDFSARVDTENSVIYAFKGLLGLFPGTFNKMPFYYKVREYNDYESRDLWEYDLKLDRKQVEFVVAHLWELGQTYFAYYYMSENCSYHILGLLEVADPKLRLVERLGFPVIPADTVKALFANPGFVQRIHYRPSNRTQFRLRIEGLEPGELAAVEALMENPDAPLPGGFSEQRSVKVLDTAIDLVGVKYARDLTKERSQMNAHGIELEQRLLERRARFARPSEEQRFPISARQMPQFGHDSSRIGLGSGYEREDGYFHALNFRLALHDLADPAVGYPDGAEIEFLPGSLRYYVESPRITLEELSLIRVKSLSPFTRFDHPVSWLLDFGSKRTRDAGCVDCLTVFGQFGAGVTLEPFGPALKLFALATAELDAPARAGYFDTLRFGVGPFGGLRLRFADRLNALFTGSWQYLPGQKPNRIFTLEGKLRAEYTHDFAFGVEGRLQDRGGHVQGVSYIYF